MLISLQIAQAITQKKALYGRSIDTKQWHKLDKVALPDAQFHFFDFNGSVLKAGKSLLVFDSTTAFAAFFSQLLKSTQTLHMFGPGEFEQTGPNEVSAVWAMEDQLILRGSMGLIKLRGGGYYREIWTSKGGEWFLASLRLERTYQDATLLLRFLMLLGSILGISVV